MRLSEWTKGIAYYRRNFLLQYRACERNSFWSIFLCVYILHGGHVKLYYYYKCLFTICIVYFFESEWIVKNRKLDMNMIEKCLKIYTADIKSFYISFSLKPLNIKFSERSLTLHFVWHYINVFSLILVETTTPHHWPAYLGFKYQLAHTHWSEKYRTENMTEQTSQNCIYNWKPCSIYID